MNEIASDAMPGPDESEAANTLLCGIEGKPDKPASPH